MISVNLTRREEKYDLYGQTLIYTYYYLNCRNVLIHSKCDNRKSNRAISMKDLLIDAIIVITIGLFAMVPVMILIWALGFIQLWKIYHGQEVLNQSRIAQN